jgi:hypothetical protein
MYVSGLIYSWVIEGFEMGAKGADVVRKLVAEYNKPGMALSEGWNTISYALRWL